MTFQSYATGTFHIWVMKPDGSGLHQLTDGHGDDCEPHFSPDGTRIAFASDRAFSGSYDIWVVDVATGALTQWTKGPADEFEPSWTPDGKEIVFVSGIGAVGTTIQAMDAAGTARTLITAPTGFRVNSPVMSPGRGPRGVRAVRSQQEHVDGVRTAGRDEHRRVPVPRHLAPGGPAVLLRRRQAADLDHLRRHRRDRLLGRLPLPAERSIRASTSTSTPGGPARRPGSSGRRCPRTARRWCSRR